MNNYCKGILFDINDINNLKLNIDICDKILLTSETKFLEFFKKIYNILNYDEKVIIYEYIKNHSNVNEALKIFEKYIKLYNINLTPLLEVDFEIKRDSDGNFYGRELSTGRIFPVIRKDIILDAKTSFEPYYFPIDSSKEMLTSFNRTKKNLKQEYESPLINRFNENYNIKKDNRGLLAFNDNSKYYVERKIGIRDNISFNFDNTYNNLFDGKIFIDQVESIDSKQLLHYYNEHKYWTKGKKLNKLINELADKNIYKKELNFIYCDNIIYKLYNDEIDNEELENYIKNMSNSLLEYLRNGIYIFPNLSIIDIDKIVEIIKIRNLDCKYYIAFLYLLSLLLDKNNNIKSVYINDYIKDIYVVLDRLKKDSLINLNIKNELVEIVKVKKLV